MRSQSLLSSYIRWLSVDDEESGLSGLSRTLTWESDLNVEFELELLVQHVGAGI